MQQPTSIQRLLVYMVFETNQRLVTERSQTRVGESRVLLQFQRHCRHNTTRHVIQNY